MSLLDIVVQKKIGLGCMDRYDALEDIRRSLNTTSPYDFAKMFGVLRNESAEDFMMEFMSAFNREVRPCY